MTEHDPIEPTQGSGGARAGRERNERRFRPRRATAGARWRAFLAPMLLLAVVLVLLLGAQSHGNLKAARAREAALRGGIEETERRIAVLTEERERLLHDPVLLERLAREQLGWVRPGDVVVVLPDGAP